MKIAAHPEALVVAGRARFTILTPRLIRMEYAEDGVFEDRATLGGTRRTLDGFDGGGKYEWVPGRRKSDPWRCTGKLLPQPLPPGLLSRSGWGRGACR